MGEYLIAQLLVTVLTLVTWFSSAKVGLRMLSRIHTKLIDANFTGLVERDMPLHFDGNGCCHDVVGEGIRWDYKNKLMLSPVERDGSLIWVVVPEEQCSGEDFIVFYDVSSKQVFRSRRRGNRCALQEVETRERLASRVLSKNVNCNVLPKFVFKTNVYKELSVVERFKIQVLNIYKQSRTIQSVAIVTGSMIIQFLIMLVSSKIMNFLYTSYFGKEVEGQIISSGDSKTVGGAEKRSNKVRLVRKSVKYQQFQDGALDKLSKAHYFVEVETPGKLVRFKMIAVGDNVFLMNYHSVKELLNMGINEFKAYDMQKQELVVDMKSVRLEQLEPSDLLLMTVPSSKIHKHVVKQFEDENATTMTSASLIEFGMNNVRHIRDVEIRESNLEMADGVVVNGYSYAYERPGFCLSLLVNPNTMKIFGVHVAGGGGR